jgi:SdrD B-like domain
MERQLLHSAFLLTHNYFPMKKGLYSVGQSLNAGRAVQRRRLFSFANYFTILFTFALLGDPSVLRAQVSGIVFRDFNADGTKQATNPIEPGLSGITVTAFNAAGTSLGTATTSSTGAYTFAVGTLASGTKVRLEFTLPAAYYPSNGATANSAVQLVTAGTGVTANLGVNAPADYCQSTNPSYVLPCYVTNASTGGGTGEAAIVTTTYSNGSTYGGAAYPIAPVASPYTTLIAAGKASTPVGQINDGSNEAGTATPMTGIANYGQVGTTWGTAYQRTSKQLFSAAFVKSNTDFGSLGIGGIYKTDLSTGTPTTSSFINLAAAPYNLSLGSVSRTLPTAVNTPYHDTDAFGKTCKIGLGGLEMSDDDKTLWAVLIGDNSTVTLAAGAATTAKLIRMDIGIPATAPTSVTTFNIPNPACIGGNYRVFALKYYRGKLYIGGVCTAELIGTKAASPNVKAIVYEFDPIANTFTKVLDGSINNTANATNGWSDSWSVILGPNAAADFYTFGRQLALSDIDFDVDGSMLLGFVDRAGYQIGFNNYSPVVSNNNLYKVSTEGDLLKACRNTAGTQWTLEMNGSSATGCSTIFGPTTGANNGQGPNDLGEFYSGDATFNNYNGQVIDYELMMGGLAMLNGSGQVLSTMSDVADFNSAGVSLLSNTTGLSDRRFQILQNAGIVNSSSANGKANSLGEPTLLCNAQPIEIGNMVWNDANNNGIQDAGETGINGVTVELYNGATKVGTATTNASGNFYFNNTNVNLNGATGLKANTAYALKIASSQFSNTGVSGGPLSNLTLTTANATSTGLVGVADNDATIVSGLATIAFTTGNAGENNHTLDFGLKQAPCEISVTTNVSGCFDSNGNASGGSSVATVQAIVDWTHNPTGETINVSCTGATAQTIDPATSAKPAILSFQVPANGSAVTVTSTFSATTTCTATQTATAPVACTLLTPCVAGSTGGQVWKDYNGDGVKDATTETQGIEGVTVKAYDCNNALVGTTTTDAKGQYTFGALSPAPSATNKLRIEFSGGTPQYKPTFSGTNGKSDVQFISSTGCTVDMGVNNPADYCQANPNLAVPCYVNGNPLGGGTSGAADWLVAFPYDITGTTVPPTHLNGTVLGTVWGQAYQRQSKKLFSAAYVKRHSGLGTYSTDGSAGAGPISGTDSGSGGIYMTDFSSGTPVISQFVNLQALGIETGDFATARNLPNGKLMPNQDIAAFDKVSKAGLGDLDLSEDEQTMFVTNLFDRKIYQLTIGSTGTAPTAATELPNAPWLSGSPCNNGVARPFGLKARNGKLYVGVVCTAENGGTFSDLNATVYAYDLTAGTWVTAINFPLDYKRGLAYAAVTASNKWNPWTDVMNSIPNFLASGALQVSYPTPVLSDIEFDENNNMILAFTDRTGDQIGSNNYGVYNTTDVYYYVSGGDILKAGYNGSGQWLLENNGTSSGNTTTGAGNNQGPGGGEFFPNENLLASHQETTVGSLAYLMGKNEVVLTVIDPLNYITGGMAWFNSTTGAKNKGYELYYGVNTSSGVFGKANGLGDLELMCNPAPIQIGNYVWNDTNRDGVQDPCESPLSNVTLSLWKNGVQIATTTTDANGNYAFTGIGAPNENWTATAGTDSILPNMAYEIRIGTTQTAIAGTNLTLTTANATANLGNDQNDSDAALVGTDAVITLTTGAAGVSNHTFDFGFKPCPLLISATPTTQNVCVGATGSNIVVSTDYNATDGIKFVKFTTDQMSGTTPTATEAAAIYAGTSMATATASGSVAPYSATYTWNGTDFPNTTNAAITYYVYAIANPDAGANCRPLLEMTVTVSPVPTGGTATVTKATCTNGVKNTNGKIEITGITDGAKYSYGTNGTTGLFALNAATISAGAITVSNLASPSTSTTYTFRIYGADTTCYEDISAILDPSVCPPCSITATFTQNACNSNSTSAITTDDYFTVTVSGVTATNGGTSGKYEVMLNGTTLNTGGTAYGMPVTVGGILYFKSDNTTTYTLTVKDLDIPTCTATFTTAPSAPCSVVGCKPVICLPVTVTRL